MKRDNWILGNGIKAGDDALLDGAMLCHVLKVQGRHLSDLEPGNVLIEILEGERQGECLAVLGKRLEPQVNNSIKKS